MQIDKRYLSVLSSKGVFCHNWLIDGSQYGGVSGYLLVDDDWGPVTCLGGQGPAPGLGGELLHGDDGGRGSGSGHG